MTKVHINLLAKVSVMLICLVVLFGNSAFKNKDKDVNGKLLAKVEVNDKHSVQFYEFEEGQVAVRESLDSEGKSKRVLNPDMVENKTLVETYKMLAKATRKKSAVPRALVEADQRVEKYQNKLRKAKKRFDSPKKLNEESNDQLDGKMKDRRKFNWHKDGLNFIKNFCNKGYMRWCPTNIGWAKSGHKKARYYRSLVMNASFQKTATHWGQYWSCTWYGSCKWKNAWKTVVLPRHYEYWYWNSGCHWRRSGADGSRIHYSLNWNPC